jgi:hypothetical protein
VLRGQGYRTPRGGDVYGAMGNEANNRPLLVMMARVRSQVSLCGICGGQSGIAADFLQNVYSTHGSVLTSIIRGWCSGPFEV